MWKTTGLLAEEGAEFARDVLRPFAVGGGMVIGVWKLDDRAVHDDPGHGAPEPAVQRASAAAHQQHPRVDPVAGAFPAHRRCTMAASSCMVRIRSLSGTSPGSTTVTDGCLRASRARPSRRCLPGPTSGVFPDLPREAVVQFRCPSH